MRIGLDLDGVCYQWCKTARYMLRDILPDSPYTKDGPLGIESQHWDYIKKHVAPAHWEWLWTEGVRLGLFRHGHLYPGTIKAVRDLAEIGDTIAITHRPKEAVGDTLAWLAFQQLPLAGVHILTRMEPKSSVMPQCDVYLDDKPENCVDLRDNTRGRVAVMNRPWNETWMNEEYDVRRVYDWPEFVAFVRERA